MKILILFAHPRFEKSRVNRALLHHVRNMPEVTLNDLYEQYPDFNIDVQREQDILKAHEIIAWHHPFYMYSAPALLKQWMDLVLEFGWAHGAGGDFLKGKIIFNVLTSGGVRETYAENGSNRHTIGEFLLPFNQTAALCKMIYLPPFAVQGTYRLSDQELEEYGLKYRLLLVHLSQGGFDPEAVRSFSFLDDWIESGHGGEMP